VSVACGRANNALQRTTLRVAAARRALGLKKGNRIMEPMWTIDVANRAFTRSDLCPEDLVWHESVFSGNGEGIVDRGGPTELTRLKQLKEVEAIHPIIREDPNYFFDLEGIVWAYTGKVGEAPDFIGFSSPNIIHIGEIK
jgi:hypothetical protein